MCFVYFYEIFHFSYLSRLTWSFFSIFIKHVIVRVLVPQLRFRFLSFCVRTFFMCHLHFHVNVLHFMHHNTMRSSLVQHHSP